MFYIYEGHTGSLYYTTEPKANTYCQQCGDSDWLKGTVRRKEDVYKLFDGEIAIDGSVGWDKEYFDEFVDSIPFDERKE